MSENIPTNVEMNTNANGTVSFATEVVATIAGLAATEVDGVACMAGGNNGGGIADLFSKRISAGKNLTKGVKVEVQDGKVIVDVTFIVEYGSPVPEVAKNIQENVKKAIETMSGLSVESVDVHVSGVSFERENKAVAEIEQQQRLLLQKQQENERDRRIKIDPMTQAASENTEEEAEEEAVVVTEENADGVETEYTVIEEDAEEMPEADEHTVNAENAEEDNIDDGEQPVVENE